MRSFSPLLPLLLLSACYGGRIDAPSLQPRAEERQPIALPDEAAESDAPVDPALAPCIAAILADAEAGHRRFEAERKTTAGALAAARGPVGAAAAALDSLRVDPAFAAAADRAAIEAAASRIEALTAAEAD